MTCVEFVARHVREAVERNTRRMMLYRQLGTLRSALTMQHKVAISFDPPLIRLPTGEYSDQEIIDQIAAASELVQLFDSTKHASMCAVAICCRFNAALLMHHCVALQSSKSQPYT
jgi:hypothetical protein